MSRKKARKTGYGDGSFRVKPSGLIEYRFIYKDEFGEKRRKSISATTRQECIDKADEFIANTAKIKGTLDENATIVSILKEKYKADHDRNFLSDAGYGRNLESVKILERSPIGNVPIATLRKQHIEKYSAKITHYSNSVIEKIFIQIKLAFSIAMEEGIITYNPMFSRSIRRPKSKKLDKKIKGLTPDEQKALVDIMTSKKPPAGRNDYRLQLFIELYSGMRMGEINALTPDCIDLENNVIHVSATISKGVDSKSFVKEGTKTETGVRDVPISNTLRPYLEEALKKYRRNKQKLLFYDHNTDKVITTNQVNSYYKRICEAAGIKSDGQHQLRHTFATRCIESGVPAIVLKTWLGHTDIHVTLDTYTDVFEAMENKAIERFDNHIELIA